MFGILFWHSTKNFGLPEKSDIMKLSSVLAYIHFFFFLPNNLKFNLRNMISFTRTFINPGQSFD